MALVMVKSFTRDLELVLGQRQAARHFYGASHWYLVICEDDEVGAFEHAFRNEDRTYVRGVSSIVPSAMEIPDPWQRQQWIKIQVPLVVGRVLQMDSDMIPAAKFDLDQFFANPVWDYGQPSVGNKLCFERKLRDLGFRYEYSFMCQMGWVIDPAVSAALLRRLPNLFQEYVTAPPGPTLEDKVNPQGETWLSEYNMLGETAFDDPELRDLYTWNHLKGSSHNLHTRAIWYFDGRLLPGFDNIENSKRVLARLAQGIPEWQPPRHEPNPSRFFR